MKYSYFAVAMALLINNADKLNAMETDETLESDWEILPAAPAMITLPPELAICSLFYAIQANDGKAMIDLLDRHKIPINQADRHGNTALHIGATTDHVQTIHTLLCKGASQIARDTNGNAPIHTAVIHNAHNSVLMLCTFQHPREEKAVPSFNLTDLLNNDQLSPLELAITTYQKKPSDNAKKIITTLALYFAESLDQTEPKKKAFFYNSYDGTLHTTKDSNYAMSNSCPYLPVTNRKNIRLYLEEEKYEKILAFCSNHKSSQKKS